MRCNKCNKTVSDNAKFCGHCGAPIQKSQPIMESETSTPQQSKPQDPEPLSANPVPPLPVTQEDTLRESHEPPEAQQPEISKPVMKPDTTQASPQYEESKPAEQPNDTQAARRPKVLNPTAPPDISKPMALPDIEPPLSKKGARKHLAWILPLIILVVTLGAFGIYKVQENQRLQEIEEQYTTFMNRGNKAIEEGLYELAETYYLSAIDLIPDSVDAGIALSRVYLCQNKTEESQSALLSLSLSEDDQQYDVYLAYSALSRTPIKIEEVDLSAFPQVTVELSCDEELVLSENALLVEEDGASINLSDITQTAGMVYLTYETTEGDDFIPEDREITVTLFTEGVELFYDEVYSTPYYTKATLELVTSDVSEYPTVKVYYRIKDSITDETIEDVDFQGLTIQESVQGGEYISREVRVVSMLDNNEGLNTVLVADKSDSITPANMEKIKQVMTEFVQSLQYSAGDKAEILAFDSIVQQMCAYTGDQSLLINGINNMSTDGKTAFYDAVYAGINHSVLQGGARCVIAFTDGMDNMSLFSANDVIQYASASEVPIYIIGVGDSIDKSTLQSIAENTGGQYWDIADLYALQGIYTMIYDEQKELYLVEYESSSSFDAYAPREITVELETPDYKGDAQSSFTPVRVGSDYTGSNTSGERYMLVKESLTWEEAAQRCQEMGGHLATITSQSEMDEIVTMAEAAEVKYLWLGGQTSYDDDGNVFGHWVTGEEFAFSKWSTGEPSRVDKDGTAEWYIMLWNIESLGGWTWNDQRNDPVGTVSSMEKYMGFICEYEY